MGQASEPVNTRKDVAEIALRRPLQKCEDGKTENEYGKERLRTGLGNKYP